MLNTIYILRNIIDNKIYIGQTWLSFEDRWNNGRGYKRNPYLYAAIKKHGKSNFKYEVLTVCGTQEAADYWEAYFIKKFNSTDRTIGYNLREGGNGGGRLSLETRHKLSVINTGKITTEETKQKLSIAGLGNQNSLGVKASDTTKAAVSKTHKGKPKSEEQKKKMSEAAIGRLHSEETKLKMRKPKKVTLQQKDLIKKDSRSIKNIAQEYGISEASVRAYKKEK